LNSLDGAGILPAPFFLLEPFQRGCERKSGVRPSHFLLWAS
jgi:hypothetical protein